MIPIKNTQTVDKNPTKTYFLDIDAGRISGNVDGILAMKQAIYLILSTERYLYPVYSFDYGVEFIDLIGQPANFLLPELKRRITEALTVDERIITATDFSFENKGSSVLVTFTVKTVYGDIEIKKEVESYV